MGEVVSTRHEQTDVKVNIPVDAVVAPLVDALSAFPHVYTVDSCEEDERGLAYVLFAVGNGSARETESFVEQLERALGEKARGWQLTIAIEWASGSSEPLARISVEAARIDELADALLAFARSAG